MLIALQPLSVQNACTFALLTYYYRIPDVLHILLQHKRGRLRCMVCPRRVGALRSEWCLAWCVVSRDVHRIACSVKAEAWFFFPLDVFWVCCP